MLEYKAGHDDSCSFGVYSSGEQSSQVSDKLKFRLCLQGNNPGLTERWRSEEGTEFTGIGVVSHGILNPSKKLQVQHNMIQ